MTSPNILNAFDENRNEFKPYGLTCELWTPNLMRKPDRHNEIELNYFPEGTMTYFFKDHKVIIPAKRLTVFWGLIPHQIIYYEGNSPYYVCTIPFSQFLEWELPASFIERTLKGEILTEVSDCFSFHDEFTFKNWIQDIAHKDNHKLILLEMHARLIRMANSVKPQKESFYSPVYSNESSMVEQIAIFIAKNYHTAINVTDIGKAVGLHPDYANSIFKKAFGSTLSEYIIEERITHAQRKLISTSRSITEIAFECGFNSISRFNAAFLKLNGCTPREFRKAYQ